MPSHAPAQPWLQVALITAAALAAYIGLRNLPQGSDISHNDFRLHDRSAPQFCDSANPQFIPVVSDSSPVKMAFLPSPTAAVVGQPITLTATLATASGKPIGPADLLESHTQLLHLLIVDPTLDDYQHIHPTPATTPGHWHFTFTPRRAGNYRFFADFKPLATGRGLYAACDLNVVAAEKVSAVPTLTPASDLLWELSAGPNGLLNGRPGELTLRLRSASGKPIVLAPVMGAFAHVVAFDPARTGYAHLHPLDAELLKIPDTLAPTFKFKVTIPLAGRYLLWAQLNVDGVERFHRFELHVGQ